MSSDSHVERSMQGWINIIDKSHFEMGPAVESMFNTVPNFPFIHFHTTCLTFTMVLIICPLRCIKVINSSKRLYWRNRETSLRDFSTFQYFIDFLFLHVVFINKSFCIWLAGCTLFSGTTNRPWFYPVIITAGHKYHTALGCAEVCGKPPWPLPGCPEVGLQKLWNVIVTQTQTCA